VLGLACLLGRERPLVLRTLSLSCPASCGWVLSEIEGRVCFSLCKRLFVGGIIGRWGMRREEALGGRKVFIDYRWGNRCRYRMRGGDPRAGV
jgi:hypothetical protein